MRLIGYTEPWTVRAGERVEVMVSCEARTYNAEVVRFGRGQLDIGAGDLRAELCPVTMPSGGRYAGRVQSLRPGSFIQVPGDRWPSLASFTLHVKAYPTSPGRREGLLTCWDERRTTGYGLFLNEQGAAELRIGNGSRCGSLVTGRPLQRACWYALTCTYDAETGTASLHQHPLRRWPDDASAAHVDGILPRFGTSIPPPDFVIAGADTGGDPDGGLCFNGKLEGPLVLAAAADDALIAGLAATSARSGDHPALVARWDLGSDPGGLVVPDSDGRELFGTVVNAPLRGVTGAAWSGRDLDWRSAPAEYAAIHFHDDDLDDARWTPDFAVDLPNEISSGFYAFHLWSGGVEDWVPFFVAPRSGQPMADVALLAPTLTYLAYANEHMCSDAEREAREGVLHTEFLSAATERERELFEYVLTNRLHSTYDRHADGSGVHFASTRRPMVNMRPHYRKASTYFRTPHHLAADLGIVRWLERKAVEHDVITDHMVHADGVDSIAGYRVVMTGTHPEYYSDQMLTAIESYLATGGRLIYLGGNGFYWVTSVDPRRQHVIEVRRGDSGTRTWSSAPGEHHHCTTGEPGGLWRSRGRPPNRLVGVGFTAQGAGEGRPYRRQHASTYPNVKFIFEGVKEATLGGFGDHFGAAAGCEIDRADPDLGTPAHALVLATATGFSDAYQHVIEEVIDGTSPNEGGTKSPLVRADLVYMEYPNGGAVFSVGSITWAACLSHNCYENNISRITENVVKAFAQPAPCVARPPEHYRQS